MKKLIRGIVEFRQKLRPEMKDTFAQLAQGQAPDTLFVTCSDSRVAPNWFASTDPGDLFVVRNVGNLISPCGVGGVSESDESEAAAIEFALSQLPVRDIVICGHSECGAMQALLQGRAKVQSPNLKRWLRHGDRSLELHQEGTTLDAKLPVRNSLSQLNVLQQIEHLKTYPIVRDRLRAGTLRLHAWWFDIARADIHAYEPEENRFVVIDEAGAQRLLGRLDQ